MSSTTVCVTDTSVIPFPTLDSAYTSSSNTAVGPLPHIPCRNARSSPVPSFSDLSISRSTSPNSLDYSRSASFVRYDSGSSSSSSAPSDEIRPTIIPRSKRSASRQSIVSDSRAIFTPHTPVSTPVKPHADRRLFSALETKKQTPLRDPSDDEDAPRSFPVLKQVPLSKVGKLRLEGSAGKPARHASDSNVTALLSSASGTVNSNPSSQTVRKKSGQPVKSSLKSTRRPELHVVTDGSFAKSEPVTPTHKAVHFDSKLEHVKLFLAEQKPLAVSRDGSPATDTDGEDFPSFIYGNDRPANLQVKMLLPNMPTVPRKEANVALQELVFSHDQRTITGTVRVRNIAFEKWVAVRFTMDWWQTTSEVTARYDKSIEDGGTFDVFSFTIRLHDIWSHIDEKVIFIALRYTVAGQEHWDNNGGRNYQIKFALGSSSEPSGAVNNEAIRNLKLKLEGVAKARSIPVPVSRIGRSFSADHEYSSFAKSSSSFGRYDFASAYKARGVKNTPTSPPPQRHTRTDTHPSGGVPTTDPTVAPWSATSVVHETKQVVSSPRSQSRPLISVDLPSETVGDAPISAPGAKSALPDSPSPSRSPEGRERNHRRGYVDRTMVGSPQLRKTPVGSPLRFDVTGKNGAAQLSRTRSYPFAGEMLEPMGSWYQQSASKPSFSIQTTPTSDGSSGESTPYETSQSSLSSTSSCTSLLSPPPACSRSDASYKQFIDQFCFYTGSESLFSESSNVLPRSHSASDIGPYVLSHSPPYGFPSRMRDLSAGFSLDPSGSTTPAALLA